jgi:hypothetical protein
MMVVWADGRIDQLDMQGKPTFKQTSIGSTLSFENNYVCLFYKSGLLRCICRVEDSMVKIRRIGQLDKTSKKKTRESA